MSPPRVPSAGPPRAGAAVPGLRRSYHGLKMKNAAETIKPNPTT